MARTRLHPATRKNQILKATKDLIELKGYQKLTVPEIVKSAGISQGSFYRFFKNIDDAVIALIKGEIFPAVQQATAHLDFRPVKSSLDLEIVLFDWFRNLGQQIAQNSILIREVLTVIPYSGGEAAAEINRFIENVRGLGEQILEAVSGAEPFRKVNSKIISHAVVGMVIGASIQAATEGLDVITWAQEIAKFEAGGLVNHG